MPNDTCKIKWTCDSPRWCCLHLYAVLYITHNKMNVHLRLCKGTRISKQFFSLLPCTFIQFEAKNSNTQFENVYRNLKPQNRIIDKQLNYIRVAWKIVWLVFFIYFFYLLCILSIFFLHDCYRAVVIVEWKKNAKQSLIHFGRFVRSRLEWACIHFSHIFFLLLFVFLFVSIQWKQLKQHESRSSRMVIRLKMHTK